MRFYVLAIASPLALALVAIALAIAAGHQNASPLDPESRIHWESAVLNNLAWKLATSPDASIRNGPLAVKAAERACTATKYQSPVLIGTLAAACAEAGQFDEAVALAQKASALAASQGDTNLVKSNQILGTWYQSHQPYHESPP